MKLCTWGQWLAASSWLALVACGPGVPAPAEPSSAPPRTGKSTENRSAAAPLPPPGRAEKQPEATGPVALGRLRLELAARPPWAPFTSDEGEPSGAQSDKPLGNTWRLLRTIHVGFGYLSFAELSLDGTQVFVLSDDEGALRRYDVKTGKLLGRYPFPDFKQFDPISFTLAPSGATPTHALVSTRLASGQLDFESGKFSFTYPHATELRFSGRPTLLGASVLRIEPQSGLLDLIWHPNAEDAQPAARLSFVERPDNWALSRDGKTLLALYYPSGDFEVVDLQAQVVRFAVAAPQYARGLALSPDGKLAAVGGSELRLYDVQTGQIVASDQSFGNNIHEARFTPDGQLLLVSAYDGKARSFVVTEGVLGTKQLLAHSGTANVYALGLNQRGDRLVTSSGDKTIKLWQR